MKKLLFIICTVFLLTLTSCEWEEDGDEIPPPPPVEWGNAIKDLTVRYPAYIIGHTFSPYHFGISYTTKDSSYRGDCLKPTDESLKIEIGSPETGFRLVTDETVYEATDNTLKVSLVADPTITKSVTINCVPDSEVEVTGIVEINEVTINATEENQDYSDLVFGRAAYKYSGESICIDKLKPIDSNGDLKYDIGLSIDLKYGIGVDIADAENSMIPYDEDDTLSLIFNNMKTRVLADTNIASGGEAWFKYTITYGGKTLTSKIIVKK